jgi:hypothetical protein
LHLHALEASLLNVVRVEEATGAGHDNLHAMTTSPEHSINTRTSRPCLEKRAQVMGSVSIDTSCSIAFSLPSICDK